jgi:hypothetical protein
MLTLSKATTLFPICFSAIVGRAAVKYATWKLERGTTLGILEQLMGSRTVASAFTTQLQIRSFNLLSVGLLIAWSLSPVGGQAILHILETPLKASSIFRNISYFNSRQQSYSAPAGPFKTQWFAGFSVLLGSAILEPLNIKTGTMDAWGNVKIPFYSSLPASTTDSDGNGWVKVSTDDSVTYSSLFGIPIFGTDYGNTTFNIESTYIELSCSNMSTSPISQSADGTLDKTTLISTEGPFLSFTNASEYQPWTIGYNGMDITSYMLRDDRDSSYIYPRSCPDCIPSIYQNSTFDAGVLAFQEFNGFDNVTSVFCKPSQVYIESSILCKSDSTSQQCRVLAQRPSLLPHMPAEITYFSFPGVALGLTALLPNSTPQSSAVNFIQNYLYDPLSQTNLISTETSVGNNFGETPLQQIPLHDIEARLGQIINAYMYGSLWNSTPYITGASFNGIEPHLVGGNEASFVTASTMDLTAMIRNQTSAFTVSGVQTNTILVYKCVYPWLVVFLTANMVMLTGAVIGVFFSRRTIVPDYLGFVSSLAKESPYIRMPDVGVNMDGMDKARLVKDVKVRLGDVSESQGGENDIGRLAFARLEETTLVKKGKSYV